MKILLSCLMIYFQNKSHFLWWKLHNNHYFQWRKKARNENMQADAASRTVVLAAGMFCATQIFFIILFWGLNSLSSTTGDGSCVEKRSGQGWKSNPEPRGHTLILHFLQFISFLFKNQHGNRKSRGEKKHFLL